MVGFCRRAVPQRRTRTARVAPRQEEWQTEMMSSGQPRSAEDSDEVWRHAQQEREE